MEKVNPGILATSTTNAAAAASRRFRARCCRTAGEPLGPPKAGVVKEVADTMLRGTVPNKTCNAHPSRRYGGSSDKRRAAILPFGRQLDREPKHGPTSKDQQVDPTMSLAGPLRPRSSKMRSASAKGPEVLRAPPG